MKISSAYLLGFCLVMVLAAFGLRPDDRDSGRMQRLAGNAVPARDSYQRYLVRHPRDLETLEALADLSSYLGESRDAEDYLRRLVAAYPDKLQAHEKLIAFYYDNLRIGDMLAARRALVAALERQPGLPEQQQRLRQEYRDLANLYGFHQHLERQFEVYQKLFALNGMDRDMTAEYLRLLAQRERKDELLAALVAARQRFPDDIKLLEGALGLALGLDEVGQAEAMARAAVQHDPQSWPMRSYLLLALRRQARQPARLPDYVQESLAAYRQFGPWVQLAEVVATCLAQQRPDLARQVVDAWKAAAPERPDAWKAELYQVAPAEAQIPAQRLALARQALQLFPGDAGLLADAAYLAMSMRQWRPASDLWARRARLPEMTADFYRSYLDCLAAENDTGFVEVVTTARRAFPADRDLSVALARWQMRQEAWDDAVQNWRSALAGNAGTEDEWLDYLASLGRSTIRADGAAEVQRALARFPASRSLRREGAVIAQDGKLFAAAAASWQELLAAEPDQALYAENLLACLAELPDRAAYAQAVAAARRHFPTNVRIAAHDGYLAQERGQWPAALAVWDDLLARDPGQAEFVENRLYCLAQLPDRPAYYQALQGLARRHPHWPDLTAAGAAHATAAADWPVAAGFWRRLWSAVPERLEAAEGLLYCLSHQGDAAGFAAALAQARERFPGRVEIVRQEAIAAELRQDWQGALPLWQRVAAARPDDFGDRASLLSTLYHLPARRADYEAALQQAVQDFPERDEPGEGLAQLRQEQERWAEALALWAQLARRRPERADYVLAQIVCEAHTKRGQDRVSGLRQARERYPEHVPILREVAIQAGDLKQWDLAEDCWRRLLARESGQAADWLGLIGVLEQARSAAAVERELQAARRCLPAEQSLQAKELDHYSETHNRATLSPLVAAAEAVPQPGLELRLALQGAYGKLDQEERAGALVQQLYREAPQDARVAAAYAAWLMDRRDYRQAKTVIDGMQAREPQNPAAMQLSRRWLELTRSWPDLAPALEARLAESPADESVREQLAYGYMDANDGVRALPHFQALHAAHPDDERYLTMLSLSASAADRPQVAADALEEAVARHPRNPDLRLLLADKLQELGNKRRARELREGLLAEAGNDPEKLKALGRKLMSSVDLEYANTAYSRVLQGQPQDPEALRSLGQIKAWTNAPNEAQRYYVDYLAAVPNDASIHMELGNVYQSLQAREAAEVEYRRALQLLEAGVAAQSPAMIRAKALAGLHRPAEAIPYFEELLRQHPEDGYLWGDYAEALADNRLYDEAEAALRRAPAHGSFVARNRRLLARIYFDQRKYDQANAILLEMR